MSDLDNILVRRTTIIAELAALNLHKIGGRPDTTGGTEGERLTLHQSYKKGLYEELKSINALITSLGGPWEVLS